MPKAAVRHVFLKKGKEVPMVAPFDGQLTLIPSFGIEGDANASATGPRQVLIGFEKSIQELGLRAGDLRENILLSAETERDFPSGTLLRIGTSALRITIPCEPCGYLRQVGIERPALAAGRRGMLGVVIEGGEVRVGDVVERIESLYPAVPERLTDRLAWIIGQIPAGSLVGYSSLADLAGVSRAYLRAFPGILRRLDAQGLPIHRVVDSKYRLIACAPDQEEKLKAEGVRVRDGVVEAAGTWSGKDLYT